MGLKKLKETWKLGLLRVTLKRLSFEMSCPYDFWFYFTAAATAWQQRLRVYCTTPLFPYLAMPFLLPRDWLKQREPGVTRTYNRGLFSDCSLLPVARLRKWISLTGLRSVRERRTKHLNYKYIYTHKGDERGQSFGCSKAKVYSHRWNRASPAPLRPSQSAADMVRAAVDLVERDGDGARCLVGLLASATLALRG